MEQRRKWATFTTARLRWVKAINRVLVQNYVAQVTKRLEVLALLQAQRLVLAAEEGGKKTKSRRPKILRRSIDNSSLPTNALPAIGNTPQLVRSPSKANMSTTLPVLSVNTSSPVSPTRQLSSSFSPTGSRRLTSSSGKRSKAPSLRRSFQDETTFRNMVSNPDLLRHGTSATSSPMALKSDSVPSLLGSYHEKATILLEPLTVQAAYGSVRLSPNK